jgi:CysZ protein
VIQSFAKAVAQLGDPALRRVVLRALLGAAAIFAVLCAAGWAALSRLRLTEIAYLDAAIDVLGGLGVVVLAALLYPAAATAIVGLCLDEVAAAVERRHFPEMPPARAAGLLESAWAGLRFAAIALALNVVALPLYLALLLVPPLNLFVFYGVNGYLVGREYFELAASRRLPPEEVTELRRAHRGRLFLAGGITAFLLTVPLVNLVAPIIGTAAMVHLFEALRRGARPGPAP